MNKKTSYLLGIIITIIIGTFLYYKYCCNSSSNQATNEVENAVPTNTTLEGLANKFKINSNEFNYQCNDNFKFMKNDFKNILPVSDSINLGIKNLKMFFDNNPNQKVLLTGYATADEKNNSAYPNLGLARANDVKNYFVTNGFEASKFDLKGEVRDGLQTSVDTILGPIDFKIFEIEPTSTNKVDWNAMKTKLNASPLILYFKTGEANIELNEEERQKFAELLRYLDNVPNSKLSVIGHTDNVGNRNTNTKLGLERANFAKDYLVRNGVLIEKVETMSKGPDEPIADNKTAEGKSKNRRTVVIIK